MVLSVLFGKNKYKKTSVSGLEMDTTMTEVHKYTAVSTTYPVESGQQVTDHIYNLPTKVTISGIVTDTPVNIFSERNRSIRVFNALVEIHRKREVVTLITGIKQYKNMVMTTLNVPRDIQTGQSLTFNMEFQQVIYSNEVNSLSTQNVDQGVVFGGVQSIIERDNVANNTLYPLSISTEPTDSLKDQSSSGVNAGIQGLQDVPTGVLPNVLFNLSLIR